MEYSILFSFNHTKHLVMKKWYVTFTRDSLCDMPCNTKWNMMASLLIIQWQHMLCEPMMNSYQIRCVVYVKYLNFHTNLARVSCDHVSMQYTSKTKSPHS